MNTASIQYASCAPAPPPAGELPAPILSLVAVLRQLEELLHALTDGQYQTKPVGIVSSNLGGHVRHCLDHVDALLGGIERGTVDYDARQRGTEVETSRQAALEVIKRQMRQLRAFPSRCENAPLRLSATLHGDLAPTLADTSVSRELLFVLSHTIHHNALIGVMAGTLGVPVPERFGYAPSTIAYLEKTQCAR